MTDNARHLAACLLIATLVLLVSCGKPEDRGVIVGAAIPDAVVKNKITRQRSSAPSQEPPSQILFGDLHVHTTFSPDAFIMAVPLMGGSGLHPPADACDFARYCSNLDFWLSPRSDHQQSFELLVFLPKSCPQWLQAKHHWPRPHRPSSRGDKWSWRNEGSAILDVFSYSSGTPGKDVHRRQGQATPARWLLQH